MPAEDSNPKFQTSSSFHRKQMSYPHRSLSSLLWRHITSPEAVKAAKTYSTHKISTGLVLLGLLGLVSSRTGFLSRWCRSSTLLKGQRPSQHSRAEQMAVSAFTETAADHNSHPRGGFPHRIVPPTQGSPVTRISRLPSRQS